MLALPALESSQICLGSMRTKQLAPEAQTSEQLLCNYLQAAPSANALPTTQHILNKFTDQEKEAELNTLLPENARWLKISEMFLLAASRSASDANTAPKVNRPDLHMQEQLQ